MKNKKERIEEHESPDYSSEMTKIEWSETSENYDIGTLYEIENNAELIRLEMNTIDFPLFTKNKRIAKNNIMTYEFNNRTNQYLKVMPLAGHKIPGEFEEKIFFALMKLYKKNNHERIIYTDFSTLISEMHINYSGRTVENIRNGLDSLSGTFYEFNNLFYSNEHKGILKNDRVMTNMFTIRMMEFHDEEIIKNPEMAKHFRNSKIKEIIEVKFSSHFYDNVIKKGYLYFDRQDLLQIEDAVARTLYMMITKWRNKELYVKRHSKFLASRIPLSWKKKNISKTLKLLKEAFEELKKGNVIRNYRFNNDSGSENSFFEIWFDESHNKNYYQRSLENTGGTEEEQFEITNQIKESIELEGEDVPLIEKEIIKQTRELLELLPEKAKSLSTMKGKVEKAIKKYGYDYTKGAVLYTKANAKASFGKYFDGAITNNWHEEFMQELKESEVQQAKVQAKKIEKENEEQQLNFEKSEAEKTKDELKAKFLSLPEKEQERIEKIVYTDYVAEGGGKATKVLKSAFERAKIALITKYLDEVNYFGNKDLKSSKYEAKKDKKVKAQEPVLEAKIVEEIPVEQGVQRDMRTLLGGLAGAFSVKTDSIIKNSKTNEKTIFKIQETENKLEKENENRDKNKIEIPKNRENYILNPEDKLLKDKKKVKSIKEILDEEVKKYENIFREFTPDEKFKLKSMTLKKYLEEEMGNTNEEVLKRIISENIVLMLDI